jgi:RNA polymerase sigma-70 factor (ECF subfamily)
MSNEDWTKKNELLDELVDQVKSGNHEAFGQVYDILAKPLYRYISFRMPEDEREDLLEGVFLKVWENLKKYKKQQNGFSAWVFRIAHNLIADFYRSRKMDLVELDFEIADEERTHSPVRFTQNSLHAEALGNALKKLTPIYRQIIVLKFINELSNKELTEILGKTEGALRILQFRALKSLRQILEKMQRE